MRRQKSLAGVLKRGKIMFKFDDESGKCIAAFERNNRVENYVCSLGSCQSPVCSCGTVYIYLSPLQDDDSHGCTLSSHRVDVDVIKRGLGYSDETKIPEDELAFANAFLSQLNDEDFLFLHRSYVSFKNEISEKANPDSIDAVFEYEEVERHGLMYAYNEVLPYGDRLQVAIEGRNYLIMDQYCLLPKCSCTDTIMSIFPAEISVGAPEEICRISLTYAKKYWAAHERRAFPLSVKTVKSAIEDQLPDFYKKLHHRHMKLKSIYAHCKKRNYATKQPLEVPSVGRNDPCPCGSGKKYKKCCLKNLKSSSMRPGR